MVNRRYDREGKQAHRIENMTDEGPPPKPTPQHMSARVPERVGPGIFSSGVLVIPGGSEFILDFVQNLGQPAQVAARVVMPHATMPQFIQALRTNLEMYTKRFGTPPELPAPAANPRKPTIQEIYDDLKITDETLAPVMAARNAGQ